MRRKLTEMLIFSARTWFTIAAILYSTVDASVPFKKFDVSSHLVPYRDMLGKTENTVSLSVPMQTGTSDDNGIGLDLTESRTEPNESNYDDYEHEREDRRMGGGGDQTGGDADDDGGGGVSSGGEGGVGGRGRKVEQDDVSETSPYCCKRPCCLYSTATNNCGQVGHCSQSVQYRYEVPSPNNHTWEMKFLNWYRTNGCAMHWLLWVCRNGDGAVDEGTWHGTGSQESTSTSTEPGDVYTTQLSTRIPTHQPRRAQTTSRPRVTTVSYSPDESEDVSCDFGVHPEHTWCGWTNSDAGALKWQVGSGRSANWLGGPTNDLSSDNVDGGFVFVETSQIPMPQAWNLYSGALLESVLLDSTGPQGRCISFGYMMDGLSPADLKVLLRSGNETRGNNSITKEFTTSNAAASDIVVWKAEFHTHGLWQQAEFLYTHEYPHQILFEAIPVDITDVSRIYRGYIALDSIKQSPALGELCQGFCNFDSGFCDWTNDIEEDDFDWGLARGSRNPVTGPSTDCRENSGRGGGYAYIDSAYPRRPGDKALLSSLPFPPTDSNSPLCMRFWFHMFGPAVGTLRVLLKALSYSRDSSQTREIWKMSGSGGNSWFAAQVTVTDVDEYQIFFEASVGSTGMSDIAIDDITFAHGPCPVEPQVAATQHGDCTFEVDECGWLGSHPAKDRALSNDFSVTWERISAQETKGQHRGISMQQSLQNEYYLNLGRKLLQPSGTRALFESREFPGSKDPLCMTFWYLMHEPFIDGSGPSLGTLRVLLETTKGDAKPIWQLSNNQGASWNFAQVPLSEEKHFKVIFEGMWGPNRASGSMSLDDITFYIGECTLKPREAHIRSEDCSFEFGLCGWKNLTRMHYNQRKITWQMASETHRPAQLPDKTFGTSGGYIFFDIFTTNQQPNEVYLISGSMNGEGYNEVCFTFWYAAFGAGESTHLQILMMPFSPETDPATGQKMWSMAAKEPETVRPRWNPGQFPIINADIPFVLVLHGKASNGGFALDDIRILPGSCKVRPDEADPAT